MYTNILIWPGTINIADPSVHAICGRSLAAIVGSNPAWAWMSVCCECCVLSERGLCVGPITRPEESYRVWCVWMWSWILDEEALAYGRPLRHGKKINTSLKRTIKQYSLYDQLSSNMFRPKLGQLQALKIQNTLRKTFIGQGTITITRGLAVGSHKNKMEHTQKKNSSSRLQINKISTDNCTEFIIHKHDGVPHTTHANGLWLIQPDRTEIWTSVYTRVLANSYVYILSNSKS